MILCELHHKFLFEVMPSEFPAGELSETEMLLWDLYYREKQQMRTR